MKVTTLNQNTQEWIEWRDTGLGASDASTILGVNPYNTAFGLWQIKTGRKLPPDLSKNPNVQRGNRLESTAKKVAEKYIGEELFPLCASEQVENFILASFDGLTKSHETVVELKCPHQTTFDDVKENGKESKAFKLYCIQVQQQLLVADAKRGYLIFYLKGTDGQKDQIIPFTIMPDKEYQKDVLMPALKEFWECIKSDTPPKRDIKRDPCDVDEKSWKEISLEYHSIKQEQRSSEAKAKSFKEKVKPFEERFIELMGNNFKAEESGVRVTRIDRKSGVDYEILVEELLLILKKRGVNISKEALVNKHKKQQSKPSYRFTLTGKAPVATVKTEIKQTTSNESASIPHIVSWF